MEDRLKFEKIRVHMPSMMYVYTQTYKHEFAWSGRNMITIVKTHKVHIEVKGVVHPEHI